MVHKDQDSGHFTQKVSNTGIQAGVVTKTTESYGCAVVIDMFKMSNSCKDSLVCAVLIACRFINEERELSIDS